MAGKISDEANLTAAQLATADEFELRDISDTTNSATGELKAIAANELAMAMELLGTAEGYSTFSDANYTALAADRLIAQIGAMSASRTVTLVAASSVPAGTTVRVADSSQSVTSTNTIVITPTGGGDTVNGTVSSSITTAGGISICISDGVGNWTVIPWQRPGAVRITGGTVTGITDLAVADGGTGASTAAAALTALGGAPSTSPTLTATTLATTPTVVLTSTATNDDPTESHVQCRVTTTNATTTSLLTTSAYMTPASGYSTTVEATVLARRTGGASGTDGDTYSNRIAATFKNVGGTVTQVGATTSTWEHESVAVTVAFDVTSNIVRLRVTGIATTDITWHGHIRSWTMAT